MNQNIEKIIINNPHRDDDGVTYFINYDARTVTAKIPCGPDADFNNKFSRYCWKHVYYGQDCTDKLPFVLRERSTWYYYNELIATVACHEQDAFDKEVGMNLAFLKLKRIIHNIRMDNINNAYKEFNKHIKALKEFEEKEKETLNRVTNRAAKTCKDAGVWL